MAVLLVRHGAVKRPLTGKAAFRTACMRLDKDSARELARQHPEVLTDVEPMLTAARRGRTGIVALLLELGVNVDVADEMQVRGIHAAVLGESLDVVKLLVAHGADVDRIWWPAGLRVAFPATRDQVLVAREIQEHQRAEEQN